MVGQQDVREDLDAVLPPKASTCAWSTCSAAMDPLRLDRAVPVHRVHGSSGVAEVRARARRFSCRSSRCSPIRRLSIDNSCGRSPQTSHTSRTCSTRSCSTADPLGAWSSTCCERWWRSSGRGTHRSTSRPQRSFQRPLVPVRRRPSRGARANQLATSTATRGLSRAMCASPLSLGVPGDRIPLGRADPLASET